MEIYYKGPALKYVSTLESGIVVPVRLLIFEKFSHQSFFILASMFINFCNNWIMD